MRANNFMANKTQVLESQLGDISNDSSLRIFISAQEVPVLKLKQKPKFYIKAKLWSNYEFELSCSCCSLFHEKRAFE